MDGSLKSGCLKPPACFTRCGFSIRAAEETRVCSVDVLCMGVGCV